MTHPGNSYSFSFEEENKKVIYATDVELSEKDFDQSGDSFFKNADILIMDAQYSGEEAISKKNWGHNIFTNAVDFANTWNIKNLYFFHHEPMYTDKKLYSMLDIARFYEEDYTGRKDVNINLAVEGQEIEV